MLARANEVRQHRGGIPANSDSRSSLNFLAAAAAADRASISRVNMPDLAIAVARAGWNLLCGCGDWRQCCGAGIRNR